MSLQQWWDAFIYYANYQVLVNRWTHSTSVVFFLVLAMGAEMLFSGWQESSLRTLFSRSKTHVWDLTSFLFNVSGFQKILTNLFFMGFIGYFVVNTRHLQYPLIEASPLWLRVLVALLLHDFLMYWSHRLKHDWDWFWITHEYHHSSTRITLLTDFRVHPLDYIVHFTLTALLLKIFFPGDLQNSWMFAWIMVVPGFLAHSRIDTGFGFIGRYFIVSPRYHHLHHSKNATKSKNYGNFFVFWDRIFGTYEAPVHSIQDIKVGLEENNYENLSPAKAFVLPVVNFYRFPIVRAKALLHRKR